MNQFTRTEQLIGADALNKIKQARVAVFGLGAVGSFAVEALARVGVGYFSLVDFDEIEISNINRQIYALHSTIGAKKTIIAKNRIKDINPDSVVKIHDSFVNAESLGSLLSQDIDVVVDAIDGLNSKVNLIHDAKTKGLKIVSSMGAAGKTDAMSIKTSDLFDTSICPLARFVRRRLRRRGISQGVPCVYSEEKPQKSDEEMISSLESESSLEDEGHGRKRTSLGSVPYVTGVFGLMVANLVIETIIK